MPFGGMEAKPIRKPVESGCLANSDDTGALVVEGASGREAPVVSASASTQGWRLFSWMQFGQATYAVSLACLKALEPRYDRFGMRRKSN
jgi:hypothetical protein